MKTQIDELIERECDKVRGTEQQMKCYSDGAHLLAPLLVEAMEALEFYKSQGEFTPYGVPSTEFTVYDYGKTACVTLRSIKQKLGASDEV